MKKLLFLICLSTIVGFTQAQSTTAHPAQADKHQKIKMAKELNFSKSQKQQMKAIKQNQKTQMATINNNTSLSENDKKQQLKQLKLEQKKSVTKLLTTEQKAKLANLKQKKEADKAKAN